MNSSVIFVDPEVSRSKFDREIDLFRQLEDDNRQRGWWLQKANFPQVYIALIARHLKPPAVVFGVCLDFSNYDLWPPSVRLVDPFTYIPYKMKELPTMPVRKTFAEQEIEGQLVRVPEPNPLMQAVSDEAIPFLCLPGVREYHAHPAHTGDSWLLHRGTSEGTLNFILNQLYIYGVQTARMHIQQVQVVMRMGPAPLEEIPE